MISLSVLLAVILDQLLGEPRILHPLVGFGKLASWLETKIYTKGKRAPWLNRYQGFAACCLLLLPPVAIAYFLSKIPVFGIFFSIFVLYLSLGAKSLKEHALKVKVALRIQDLPRARQYVSLMVSRDCQDLNETEMAKATIESILENGNDAVFASLFWFLVLGAPGAVLYRLANTLDAMWGYKNDHYFYFGFAAARFDDILNWIPARLTALCYALAGNTVAAIKCWACQAHFWYSPNAGPVMASGAGALYVRLGGNAIYHGKPKTRPELGIGPAPSWQNIKGALNLINKSLLLWLVTLFILETTKCWNMVAIYF